MNPPSSILVMAALLLLLSLSSHAHGQEERRIFGKGSPFTLEELPAGKLKTQLQQLDPVARGKAMKWLHTLQFNEGDAEFHLRADAKGGIFIVCSDEHGKCKGRHCSGVTPERTPEPVDESGASSSVENADSVSEEPSNPVAEGASVPVSSPPAYNSKPGAPYHIYLDFNGAYVTGKAWSETDGTTTWTTWDCHAWSSDSDRTTFSDAEQTSIKRMWERVAEDYSSFDVNVTTDVTYDPDNYTGDKNKVGWLLITPTTDKAGARCPHYGAGGVAYVGVFGQSNYFSTYQPAWTTPMGDANTAEAASHEMGHNLGLSHDGTSTLTYYGGHAGTSSAPSWGPIMGTGYNRNVSQWSKSTEYYDGNRTQDDFAVITGKIPYRADEHGDNPAGASILSDPNVNVSSVIERSTDVDYFTFTTGTGTVSFNADAYKCAAQTWGANLDIVLELYNSSQSLVASSNPAADVDATLSYNVTSAGEYYLAIKSTGCGSPLNSNPSGYTAYGSAGQYTLTGNFTPTDSVTLTSPNGGETWFRGTSVDITWASGMGGDVKIELLKNGSLDTTIAASTPNDGSHSWSVPTGQTTGTDYTIRITSLVNTSKTDVSFANFSIGVPPNAASLPYAESFESGLGNWTQLTTEDMDWTRQTGGTGSAGTGPSAAQNGSYYLYTEASSPNFPSKTAEITSWFDLTGSSNAQLKFYYHMYGAAMGSLEVLASSDGVNYSSLWSRAGDQGNSWSLATVDLSGYSGQYVQLMFRGLTGTDFTSDISIDNISIADTNAPEIVVEQPASTSLTDGNSTIDYGSVQTGSSSQKTFTIRNTGNQNLTGLALSKTGTHSGDYTLGSLSTTTLASGASTTFTVTFNPSAGGTRTAAIQIASNDEDENPFDISLTGVGATPGNLSVTGVSGLAASGSVGGPFSPSSIQYTLENTGGVPINWTAGKTQSWVSLSASSGSLDGGASTVITVSINSNANSLSIGGYSDTVTFTNTTNSNGNTTRDVALSITGLTTLWSQNFDASGNAPTGWSSNASNGSATWSVSTVSSLSRSTTNCYSAPVPSSQVTSHLVSSSISIPGTANTSQIRFWHNYNLNANEDGGRIELSVDGGAWFGVEDTGSGASFASGGYDGTINNSGNPSTRGDFNGLSAWTGSSSGYVETVINLNSAAKYSGKSLKIRWSIGTNSSSASQYWYVDDVSVLTDSGGTAAGTLAVTGTSGLTASGGTGGPFSPSSIQYTLENTGDTSISWTGTKTNNWITVTPATGTLAAGATATVTVSFNSNTNSLSAGSYSDTVSFTNTTNNNGDTTRSVNLTVIPAGTLAVTPAGDLNASGLEGSSSYSPASQVYTLENTGSTTIDWTASKAANWVTLSASGGTLTAGATTTVTVSINTTSANSLGIGAYSDTVSFANTTNGNGNTTRAVTLNIQGEGSLSVAGTNGLTSSGDYGGSFSPDSIQYTLSNPGATALSWTASKTKSWVSLSSTGGTLAAGATTTVTVSINTGANTLDAGSHTDTVTFTNTTNGGGNTTRAVALTVNKAAATVTLASLSQTYDGSPKAATATTVPSGLATSITYDGSSTAPTNAGTYTAVATITDNNYTGSDTQNLVIAKADQTITFGALDPVLDDASPFALNASSDSGLEVTYASSNTDVATISGNTVTVVGLGSTTITASQSGSSNYNAATDVQRTLNVERSSPLGDAGGTYKVLVGQTLTLDGSGSVPKYGESITSYEWDLNNDGSFGDVTGVSPSAIAFDDLMSVWGMTQGLNTIKLKITDSSAQTSTVSTTVELVLALQWDANGTSAGQTNGGGAWEGANLWWDGETNTSWSSGSNVIFGGLATNGGTVTLAGPTTANSITVNQHNGTYNLGSSGQTLTINEGITIASNANNVTIASPVSLAADQVWSTSSSGTFRVNGTITGSGGLTKTGSGLMILAAGQDANNYSGPTKIFGGVLQLGTSWSSANNIPGGLKGTSGTSQSNLEINGGTMTQWYYLTRNLGTGPSQIQITGGRSGFTNRQNDNVGSNWRVGNDANYEIVWGSPYFKPSILVLQDAAASPGTASYTIDNNLDLNGSTRTIEVGASTGAIGGVVRNSSGTAGLIKQGAGTLILKSAATYNGDTTIEAGTLQLDGVNPNNDSSMVIIASGATLNLNFTGTDTVDKLYVGGTGLAAGVYKAVGSTEIGTELSAITGTGTLTVTTTPSAFDSWSGGSGFSNDSNGDGISDGLAWVFGASNNSTNARNLLPIADNSSDATYMIFNYRRSDEAATDANTTIVAQYGDSLGSWTDATHDGSTVVITAYDDFYDTGVDKVEVKINRNVTTSGKLFSRLSVTRTP